MADSRLRSALVQAALVRLEQLRELLQRQHLEALWLTTLSHIRYLTGFSGSSASMLITAEAVHFFTDDRYDEQVRHELFPVSGLAIHITREPVAVVAQQGLLRGIATVGFEVSLGYGTVLELRRRWRPSRLIPFRGKLDELFIVKTPAEVELLRRAALIASRTFEAVLESVRPGMTEHEVAAEISYRARQFGSEGDAFPIIVASGERSALPHGRASARRLRKNDIVTVDFGCIVGGYVSDITRTFVLGRANAEQRRVYQVVWEAQEQALEALQAGIRAREADATARRVIEAAGFGAYFRHSLGHGIGRSVHEPPALSPRAPVRARIPEGAVVTVEPGIYLPGKFGIRVEDDVHVTATGAVLLTTATREFLSV
ncbi:MAG: Xaa-Pro peptidase family protein [Chlorobiota bacterium]